MTTGTLACLSFNMKYKKNIFGKIINEENETNFFRNNLENNSNPYIRKKIGVLHSFAGWFFIYDIYIFIDCVLNIPVKFENKFMTILMMGIFPFSVGIIKIAFIDPFFDKISYKIKWFFMIFVFAVFSFFLWYIKTH